MKQEPIRLSSVAFQRALCWSRAILPSGIAALWVAAILAAPMAAGAVAAKAGGTVAAKSAKVPKVPKDSVRLVKDPVKEEPPITDEQRNYWSFKPLLKPAPPQVANAGAVRNPIDQFVVAKLEAHRAAPAPQADPATLIRRVTFDLTGLPPSPDEVRKFAADCQSFSANSAPSTPDPYEALVDRLLASPRYGEKWAQPWLDLARFAETDGFEKDIERKEAWKYRDWVIGALNRDMRFDDFVAFQIAGDEMSPENAVATGFLLAGPDMPDTNFQSERRHLLLNDVTSTVGSTFLGLTIGCAQCHDHPYDPISQADFYRLRAFFDNLVPFKKDQQIGTVMKEAGRAAPASHVCIRGDYERPGGLVQAAFPRIANASGLNVSAPALSQSSGRRTALARWLTQPTNRLFMRTAANRLWQNHFGQPLTATPNDLGHQGEAPTHPELLDWLATEIPLRGWSLKAMHRLIVTSATYRQAGTPATDAGATDADPQNRWIAHFPRRRLSGEELRDAMLTIAGRLNLKAGGPSVRLPLPAEVSVTLPKEHAGPAIDPTEFDRRSIYAFARRNLRYPLFDLFDRPDALLTCSRRHETVTAPQALTLFNSEFSLTIAKALAGNLMKSRMSPPDLVAAAVWQCDSRGPTEKELALGTAFLQHHSSLTASPEETLTDYCLALINASAFCYID